MWALGWFVSVVLLVMALDLLREPDWTAKDDFARETTESPQALAGSPASGAPGLEAPQRDFAGKTRVAASEPVAAKPGSHPDLRVAVRDPSGAPLAAVPVELLLRDRLRPELESDLGTATSTDQGTAVFAGFAGRVSHMLFAPEFGQWEVRVRCDLPFDEPSEAVVLEQNVTAEDVLLILPPVGWMDVRIRAGLPDGSTPAAPSIVWKRLVPGSDSPPREILGASARIGPLGLGWKLQVEARSAGRADSVGTLVLDGPTRPGEVVTAEITATDALRIHGIAVDASGQPFADVHMIARIGLGTRVLDTYARTDSSGRFAVAVDAGAPFEFLELKRCDIPRPVPAGRYDTVHAVAGSNEIDVGKVVLQLPESAMPPRLVAAGMVVDERGTPLARVRVSALARPGDHGSGVASVRSAADGSFRLIGTLPEDRTEVYLVPVADGFVTATPTPCPVGEEGVQLSLTRGGAVIGSVLVSDWVPRDLVSLTLHGGNSVDKRVLADWGVEFRFEGEDDHDGILEVGIRESNWVIERRSGILVRAATCVDLGPIDIRDRLRPFHLIVRDPAGVPVAGRWLHLQDAFGAGFNALQTSSSGEIVNLAPSQVDVLCVTLDGFDEATATLSSYPVEVTLYPRDG